MNIINHRRYNPHIEVAIEDEMEVEMIRTIIIYIVRESFFKANISMIFFLIQGSFFFIIWKNSFPCTRISCVLRQLARSWVASDFVKLLIYCRSLLTRLFFIWRYIFNLSWYIKISIAVLLSIPYMARTSSFVRRPYNILALITMEGAAMRMGTFPSSNVNVGYQINFQWIEIINNEFAYSEAACDSVDKELRATRGNLHER